VLLAGAALVFSRPVLALVAAPVILSIAWGWRRRQAAGPVRVDAWVTPSSTRSDVDYHVVVTPQPDTDAISIRLLAQSSQTRHVVVAADSAGELSGRISLVHSGPQEVFRVDFSLISAGGGQLSAPAAGPRIERVVSPATQALRRLPLPHRMVGLTGNHDSVRPGDGGEFRDIGQFRPGDRLRRIDWKVTARRAQAPGDLYVRHSYATADATVLIVLDSRDSVSQLVTSWKASAADILDGVTSLDQARAAASSLASAYIRAGDRVGFQDLAGSNRMIAPSGGVHHLHRLLPAIARAEPVGAPRRRVRAPIIPSGALVYVISTFLDDEAARLASVWRASGHRVIAVDSIPVVPPGPLTREEQTARAIITQERVARLTSLAAEGVDVVGWNFADGLSPESKIALIARPSRAQR
jgi:uncharacterized protein (DUF58 family)